MDIKYKESIFSSIVVFTLIHIDISASALTILCQIWLLQVSSFHGGAMKSLKISSMF